LRPAGPRKIGLIEHALGRVAVVQEDQGEQLAHIEATVGRHGQYLVNLADRVRVQDQVPTRPPCIPLRSPPRYPRDPPVGGSPRYPPLGSAGPPGTLWHTGGGPAPCMHRHNLQGCTPSHSHGEGSPRCPRLIFRTGTPIVINGTPSQMCPPRTQEDPCGVYPPSSVADYFRHPTQERSRGIPPQCATPTPNWQFHPGSQPAAALPPPLTPQEAPHVHGFCPDCTP
jgi:hypothetical protein